MRLFLDGIFINVFIRLGETAIMSGLDNEEEVHSTGQQTPQTPSRMQATPFLQPCLSSHF